MKKLIISIIIIISVISFPVLSQVETATANVKCLGSSLIFPQVTGPAEEMGTIQATVPITEYTPNLVITWTFMGDGSYGTPREVIISEWDQKQDAGLGNGNYVHISSEWSSDGPTGVNSYPGKVLGDKIPVTLRSPGTTNHMEAGCGSEGNIYLTITKLWADSHFVSNMGPVVFTFMITSVD